MRRFLVAMAAGLLLVSAGPANAQLGDSSIRGRVVDESGAVLPGATVVVTNEGSGIFRQVVSNADGTYFITGIIPGPYTVTSELDGFRKYERKSVLLELGKTTTLDITLQVGGLEEVVTVTTETPLVDLTSKQVGGNVTASELTGLPSGTRSWLGFVGLLPGIQVQSTSVSFGGDSINVNGQSNRNNNFTVDGGGNNDDYLGQSFGGQTRLALEAVQEFQVLTNQFDAEFGRSTGAVVNAVTKQGTNDFHGVGFGYFTESAMMGKDYFTRQRNLDKPDTLKREYGGVLGGPIVRDKAHFLYSLERVELNAGRSAEFPTRPELDYSVVQKTRVWNHMIRFDHQINADNTWGVRYLREDSPTYDGISGYITYAARRDERDIDETVVGTWNTVFGNNKFNTIRFSRTYEDNPFASPEWLSGTHQWDLPPSYQMLSFVDNYTTAAGTRIDTAYQLDESFSMFKPNKWGGDHDIKFGGQYIYVDASIVGEGNMNGTFTFSTDQAFDPANPRTYPERLSIVVPSPENTVLNSHVAVLFAQDKWQRGNLTVNAGLRYDLEIIPMTHRWNPLVPEGEYPLDKNNLAPRFGFAYNPGGSGTSVFRGGYGLFYDKTHLIIMRNFIQAGVYSSSFTAQFPASQADRGPSNGQLPTDPMLVGGPVVNRALLNQLYPAGTQARNNGTVYLESPERTVPYTHQLSVGYQRQLGTRMSFSADFIHSEGRDLLITYNLNPMTRANTSRTGPLTFTDTLGLANQLGISPFRNRVLTRLSDGTTRYDGLNLQLEKRYSGNWSARVSYSLGYSRGNNDNSGTDDNSQQVGTDKNLDRLWGPTATDRTHNLSISGRAEIPRTKGLTVSAIYRFMSGAPFTLYNTNVDADQNGELFDYLPAGSYAGTGNNAFETDFDGGRNGARGPNFTQMDMRLGYNVRMGPSRALNLFFEVFNVFNSANFDNPNGDMRASNFLLLSTLRGGGFPRQAQLGVRFAF
ncbi:MAG: TonB-dependent receptor [Acidobacteria bacterium]|nr:TonB-dependent receptor [Acidobacteriota bacterium]